MCMTPLVCVSLEIPHEPPPLEGQVFGNSWAFVLVSYTLKKINRSYTNISPSPTKPNDGSVLAAGPSARALGHGHVHTSMQRAASHFLWHLECPGVDKKQIKDGEM